MKHRHLMLIPIPLIFPNPLLGVECIELRGTTASRPPLPLPPQPHKPQIGGGYSPVFNTAPPIITCRPFNIARFKTNHIITSDTSDLPSEHVNSEFSTWCVSQDSLKQISKVTWLILSKSENLSLLGPASNDILTKISVNFAEGKVPQENKKIKNG